MKSIRRNMLRALACVGLPLAVSCGDAGSTGSGSVRVLLEPEPIITDGLAPGDEVENIRDGWSVSFSTYVVTIGDIHLHFATDEHIEAEASDVFVVDLAQLPASGLPLWEVDGLRSGRWILGYATAGAGDGATRDETVDEGVFEEMAANDWTYFIDGELDKSDGQSCPPASLAMPGDAEPNGETSGGNPCYDASTIRLTLRVAAETRYTECKADGLTGFAVPEGGSQTVALTIHGDHLFFNGFPEGDEGGVMRLAQWVADSDLNLDGTLTTEELGRIPMSDLPEIDDRYQLSAPTAELETMLDFAVAQLKMQGHFQGEGSCTVDGEAHEHEHEE